MNNFVVLLFTVFASAWGASIPDGMLPQLDGRIVGGQDASISSFPWQVSLQLFGSHFCGGSIYSNNIVVTAAHCLRGVTASNLKVRAGATNWRSGGVLVSVAAVKIHEGYNSGSMVNDVGVIRLSSSLSFSSTIQKIAVAKSAPAHGSEAVVSGWGTETSGASSHPDILQSVAVNIVSLKECSSSSYDYGSEVSSTMICAAATGKDSCQGDSGGPLVSNSQLVGVVSWGYGCALANYPGVYADAASLNSWISSAAKSV